MPPVRRSTRRKKLKVASKAEEMERATTRVTKRRETLQLSPGTFTKLLRTLPSTFAALMSDDPVLQLDATTDLFKLLSVDPQPPIDEIVRLGAVPRVIEFLKLDDYQHLQVEAARVLKNIGTGSTENTKVMVDCGAVPLLVKLTDSSSDHVKEQALCALGNIAADSPEYCGLILTCGALHPLLSQLNEHDKLSLLRTAVWTLTNLCGGTLQAQNAQLEPAIPVLASLLSTNDAAVLSEACWALSYLFKGGLTQDLDVFTATTCPKILEFLKHPCPLSVLFPAIMVLSSISENDELVKCAYNCRAVQILFEVGPPPHDCISYVARVTCEAILYRVDCLRKKGVSVRF